MHLCCLWLVAGDWLVVSNCWLVSYQTFWYIFLNISLLFYYYGFLWSQFSFAPCLGSNPPIHLKKGYISLYYYYKGKVVYICFLNPNLDKSVGESRLFHGINVPEWHDCEGLGVQSIDVPSRKWLIKTWF